jgi:hypothetical protein
MGKTASQTVAYTGERCDQCDDGLATVRVTFVNRADSMVLDTATLCHECAAKAASRLSGSFA